LANEFRNFQLRVITDATAPTSVGQRNRISSHTAGPSVVYTMATTWGVTPSSSAVYVLEYPNDLVLSAATATTTYTYFSDVQPGLNSGAATADSWSTTMYGARGTAATYGTEMICPFGVSNAVVTGITTQASFWILPVVRLVRGRTQFRSTSKILSPATFATDLPLLTMVLP
jgi:hypothetical protein